jgi:Ca2+-binding RTX toxin-like protein
VVSTRSGDDVLAGGHGADQLVSGEGRDELSGQDGADSLRGGPGDDALTGGGRADDLHGLAGNDTIRANGDGFDDTITCGAGSEDHVFADPTDTFPAVGPDACELVN